MKKIKIRMSLSSFLELLIQGCLIIFGFMLIDLLWLNALPILHLSYGPVRPQLFVFTIFRIGILFIWMVFVVGFSLKGSRQTFYSHSWSLIIPNLILLGLALYGCFYEPFHLTVSQI